MTNQNMINLDSDKFNKAMQEASESYVRKHFSAPEIDKEWLKGVQGEKRPGMSRTLTKVAAVFMIILVGGAAAGIWANADGAYGGKRLISKYMNVTSPLDIKETVEDGNPIKTAVITEESSISDAAEFAGDFYKPSYIPKGYAFKSLTVSKSAIVIFGDYIYENQDKEELALTFEVSDGDSMKIDAQGKPHKSPVTGNTYYAYTEGNEYSLFSIEKYCNLYIDGVGDIQEGIKIMDDFSEYE